MESVDIADHIGIVRDCFTANIKLVIIPLAGVLVYIEPIGIVPAGDCGHTYFVCERIFAIERSIIFEILAEFRSVGHYIAAYDVEFLRGTVEFYLEFGLVNGIAFIVIVRHEVETGSGSCYCSVKVLISEP